MGLRECWLTQCSPNVSPEPRPQLGYPTIRAIVEGDRLRITRAALLSVCMVCGGVASSTDPEKAEDWLQYLRGHEISASRILGVDADGIPLVCGTAAAEEPGVARPGPTESGLPADTRSWEAIPGVIRTDGVEELRLEVDVNGPVNMVTLEGITAFLTPNDTVEMRDDGVGADLVAGDFTFTAGPFRYDTTITLPPTYLNDPDSPAGLYTSTLGRVVVEELDQTETEFLIPARLRDVEQPGGRYRHGRAVAGLRNRPALDQRGAMTRGNRSSSYVASAEISQS